MNIEFDRDGAVLAVKPEGRLDGNTAPKLEAMLRAELGESTSLILDFAGVDYISSAGLRVILAMDQLMAGRGGSLKLIHVGEAVLSILDMTGFLDIIDVET